MGLLSSGCGAGEAGEWFGVAVAGFMSDAKVLEAHLTSSERAISPIDDAATRYDYPHADKLRVPEQFDLRWRTASDAKLRHTRFRVRAQLPPEVLHKITAGYERTHTLSLYFRVRSGHAECYWRLADISQESKKEREAAGKRRLGDAMVLEGVIAGEEIVGPPDGSGSQVTDD